MATNDKKLVTFGELTSTYVCPVYNLTVVDVINHKATYGKLYFNGSVYVDFYIGPDQYICEGPCNFMSIGDKNNTQIITPLVIASYINIPYPFGTLKINHYKSDSNACEYIVYEYVLDTISQWGDDAIGTNVRYLTNEDVRLTGIITYTD